MDEWGMRRAGILLCAVVVVFALSATAASAGVIHPFLFSFESASGPFANPNGVAVDSAGDVYVADIGRNVVEKFAASGKPVNSFSLGTTNQLTDSFSFFNPAAVVIDNSGSTAKGDIYVIDYSNNLIKRYAADGMPANFTAGHDAGTNTLTGADATEGAFSSTKALYGIAIDHTSGNIWVRRSVSSPAELNIDEFEPSGKWVKSFSTGKATAPGFALDSADNIYFVAGNPNTFKENSAGSPSGGTIVDSCGCTVAVTVDGSDNVYVDNDSGTKAKRYVAEYDAAGKAILQFGASQLSITNATALHGEGGIAVSPANGDIYVSNPKDGKVYVFGTALLPSVTTFSASDEQQTSATLEGAVNTEGVALSDCHFEYGTTTAYGQSIPCAQSLATINAGPQPVSVNATVVGLRSGTEYHFRLVAGNSYGSQPEPGLGDKTFTTKAPALDGTWSTDVTATSATLVAQINPQGLNISACHFEYRTDAETSYKNSIACSPNLGAVTSDVTVSAQLRELFAETIYHFRVVVTNTYGTVYGKELTLTTQTAGPEFALPDNRAWELVSPPDKHGALLRPIAEAGLIQAAADGTAMTYWSLGTPTAEAPGAPPEVQLLSRRGVSGWSTQDIATPHDSETTFVAGGGLEYRFFTPDLSSSLVEPRGGFTPLTGETSPEATERTPFLRHDSTCEAEPATCYEPLVTGVEGYADVPPGTKFGGNPPGKPVLAQGAVIFAGASSDLQHAIVRPSLESELDLTSPGVKNALYEWSAAAAPTERLQLVSVLPNGTEVASSGIGYKDQVIRHAISNDGTRIFFSSEVGGEQGLYMRDTTIHKSVRLDVQEGVSGGTPAPQFQTASANGSIAFFTDSQRLTTNAGGSGADLYACAIVETAGALTCKLTDLTPEVAGQSADVQGAVIGASEDGSYVYFVANGAFGTGAVHGTCYAGAPTSALCNLYMVHYDSEPGMEGWEAPQLIAVLSGADKPSWAGHSGGTNLEGLISRVSPDGRWLAFMSQRSLTGYDNHDAASGEPDEEVFLYHASASASMEGKLTCASCNPTGARPRGMFVSGEYPLLVDGVEAWGATSWHWLAANVPGWTPFTGGTAAYQSRYLSNSGRLFFNSSDALVPQDVNHNEDVYEYEPPGVGGCTASTPSYSAQDGGCVDLISSGTSSGESAFLDASESGDDVFFLTAAKLVSQDVDTALDVYDAHVCSTQAPCVTTSTSTPVCSTADSCRASLTQQPSLFGAPPSATFSGGGNLAPPSAAATKAKALTRAQKLAEALKACHKQKKRKRRAACERQARKRYGARSVRRAKKSRRGRR